jgi:hypothetical protein
MSAGLFGRVRHHEIGQLTAGLCGPSRFTTRYTLVWVEATLAAAEAEDVAVEAKIMVTAMVVITVKTMIHIRIL